MKKVFGLLFVLLIPLVLTGCTGGDGEKDPFWTGSQMVQVCKNPYYSSDDCYELSTYMAPDGSYAQINFPNGGYIYTYDIVCYDAATFGSEPEYVFCRSWDSDGQQWDFMPLWINY